jgi:hypothetical protein
LLLALESGVLSHMNRHVSAFSRQFQRDIYCIVLLNRVIRQSGYTPGLLVMKR